jgi:putative transposase
MGNLRIPLEPGNIYHVYNHGNADDNIFRTRDNYYYFLQRYALYVDPIVETFAYSLLPNHFHFAVQIAEEDVLRRHFEALAKIRGIKKNPADFRSPADFVLQQFNRFFISYSKSFNKVFDRTGSLFLDSFQRKVVTDEKYLRLLIHYIHRNPVHHGFVVNPADWEFSSYNAIVSDKDSRVEKEKVIHLFGSKESFREFHLRQVDMSLFADVDF